MPLVQSKSDKARSKNIATEIKAGKPAKQAEAIGYAEQASARKVDFSKSGMTKAKSDEKRNASSQDPASDIGARDSELDDGGKMAHKDKLTGGKVFQPSGIKGSDEATQAKQTADAERKRKTGAAKLGKALASDSRSSKHPVWMA